MTLKIQTPICTVVRFTPLLLLGCWILFSCSDDSQSTNEREVITTMEVTLKSDGEAGHIVTLTWDDLNLNGTVETTEMNVSGDLFTDTTYQASVRLLNKAVNPEVDFTEEFKEEAEEHIFCYTVSGAGISITNRDKDKYKMPLGLTSIWTTSKSVSTGTVNITLRHQPGVKTGDCPGYGETDVAVTFPVGVSFEVE